MTSWVAGATGSGFDDDHLPYGVFSAPDGRPDRVGVRIGDRVLDVASLAADQDREWTHLFAGPVLNPLLAAGPAVWARVRGWITEQVSEPAREAAVTRHLLHLDDVRLRRVSRPREPRRTPALDGAPAEPVRLGMPIEIGDYVDFYASKHHASAVGRLFRPDAEPLLPNWKHLPVGYHGRAGTVVPSGTPIRRPCGQSKPTGAAVPVFGPSRRLDIEAELGFVIGVPSEHGTPVPVSGFADHVFGVCLLNDWSARDIQAWEYVPLGPFLGKSFATSISPWITPLAALSAARVAPPERTHPLLDYLADDEPWGLDLSMTVSWNGSEVSHPPFAAMYWTGAQMLAHLTVNGASVRTGDLFASGTVSGPGAGTAGSFLELTHGWREPLALEDGSTRTALEDGDTVVITATAPSSSGGTIRLGEVSGTVLPATC